jgi:hypothetical protein
MNETVKTKEEWARRHLAQMGNEEPTQSAIDYYLGFLDPNCDHYDQFFVVQYQRWVARDEDAARLAYDDQSAEARKKTLNERYIEDEDNDGPFWEQ